MIDNRKCHLNLKWTKNATRMKMRMNTKNSCSVKGKNEKLSRTKRRKAS